MSHRTLPITVLPVRDRRPRAIGGGVGSGHGLAIRRQRGLGGRMAARSAFGALVVGVLMAGGLTAGVVTAPEAAAATGTAPVTAPDKVIIKDGHLGGAALVDVLANDTDADGDELQVCRLGPIPKQLNVEKLVETTETSSHDTSATVPGSSGSTVHQAGRPGENAQLFISSAGKPGTYTLTYYACDYSYLTPGTLTVIVKEPAQVKVKVTKLNDRPGHLKVTNTSGFPVRFVWGSHTADKADGGVSVTRKPVIITVNRPSIIWAAFNRHTSDFGYGAVRGIRLPAGTKHLPAGAPNAPLNHPDRTDLGPLAMQAVDQY